MVVKVGGGKPDVLGVLDLKSALLQGFLNCGDLFTLGPITVEKTGFIDEG